MPSRARPVVDRDAVVEDLLALTRVLVKVTAHTLASLDTEVTLQQHRMLVVLASRGPQRSADLGIELEIHPSTVTRTAERLVRRGLVRRYHGDDDRRAVRLALTPAGRDLVGDVMRRRAAEVRRLVGAARRDGTGDPGTLLRDVVSAAGEPSEAEFWRRWSRAADEPVGEGADVAVNAQALPSRRRERSSGRVGDGAT